MKNVIDEMICTKDENNVHIQGTCSLSAYHVSLINSSPPKKITNNPHQQPTYMYGPIRNIFYIRQADELQSMYPIAGQAAKRDLWQLAVSPVHSPGKQSNGEISYEKTPHCKHHSGQEHHLAH